MKNEKCNLSILHFLIFAIGHLIMLGLMIVLDVKCISQIANGHYESFGVTSRESGITVLLFYNSILLSYIYMTVKWIITNLKTLCNKDDKYGAKLIEKANEMAEKFCKECSIQVMIDNPKIRAKGRPLSKDLIKATSDYIVEYSILYNFDEPPVSLLISPDDNTYGIENDEGFMYKIQGNGLILQNDTKRECMYNIGVWNSLTDLAKCLDNAE